MYTAIVLGGTGATGRYIIGELLSRNDFNVISLGRRGSEVPAEYNISTTNAIESGRLKNVTGVNFENPETYRDEIANADVVLCALGTTRRDAGSAEEFVRIDQGFVLKSSEVIQRSCPNLKLYSYVSSMGTNADSWFLYPKTKGQTENSLKDMNFPNCHIIRPGLLGRGDASRTVEKMLAPFKCLLPYITCRDLAKATVADAVDVLTSSRADGNKDFSNSELQEQADNYTTLLSQQQQ